MQSVTRACDITPCIPIHLHRCCCLKIQSAVALALPLSSASLQEGFIVSRIISIDYIIYVTVCHGNLVHSSFRCIVLLHYSMHT